MRKALLLALTIPLAWGTSYTFMAMAMADVQPVTVVALRCGLAFLLMVFPFAKYLKNMDSRAYIYSAVSGLLLFLVYTGLVYGVAATSASVAGFLTSLTVILVPLIHSIVIRKLPPVSIMLGVVIVTIGLYLINGSSLEGLNLGAAACLGAAFLYAVHILLTARFVQVVNSVTIGIAQMGFAALFATLLAFVVETPCLPATTEGWTGILGLAVFCSAYGFVMQAVVQKYISPEVTGFVFSLEPISSAAFAYLLLGENMGVMGYIGAAFIFAGVSCALYKPRQAEKETAQPAEAAR